MLKLPNTLVAGSYWLYPAACLTGVGPGGASIRVDRATPTTWDMRQVASKSDDQAAVTARPALPEWFERRRAQIDAALTTDLKNPKSWNLGHSRLRDAVEYSVSSGGKRLRPLLVLESCSACGGDEAAALPAALAIEYVHTFSLIHDDLPAMDNDDLRRGRPTNHKVYGEALAILAGDWLLAHAFRLLSRIQESRFAGILSDALADGTLAMIEGQVEDLAGELQPPNEKLVTLIHELKTAKLIEAACRMGAVAANADREAAIAMQNYGNCLGRAFQIADDLLDVEGSEAAVGKAVGKDAGRNKQTHPGAYGIDKSRAELATLVRQARASLKPLGDHARNLHELAELMAIRDR